MARPLLLVALACALGACTQPPPNVVLIVVDDLGWMDTGVYGSPYYRTPAVDRLAREGVRFRQFYAASPVCSPTRASIMTGRDPARLHLTNWIGGEQAGRLLQAPYERQLPLSEETLGDLFSRSGYRTGYIGKWHLGTEGFKPTDQGFESSFAVNNAGQPGSYFPPYENPNWPITNVPDLAGDPESAFLTDRLADGAVAFLEESDERPFLLVLAHYAVHTPLQAPADRIDAEARRLPDQTGEKWAPEHDRAWANRWQDNPTYAAMVASTDLSIGRVLDTLDDLGLAGNTIVAFVSDNGGLSTLPRQNENMATSNAPLRAGKGWLLEGGIRIPFIVRWPGHLPGNTAVDSPAISNDILPTLADLAGVEPPAAVLDGISLRPAMEGRVQSDRPLFWHFPHYHGSGNRPGSAVRAGPYKLLEWFEGDPPELFNLKEDPYEQHDIAREQPALVDSLQRLLADWRTRLDAAMPVPNPEWIEP